MQQEKADMATQKNVEEAESALGDIGKVLGGLSSGMVGAVNILV
jgi:hypothetical protein